MPSYAHLAVLDRPELLQFVFYPRKDFNPPPPGAADYPLPVAPGIALSSRLYAAGKAAPTILYFHGNGEVVADHDTIAPAYHRLGLNLFVVDYRGYGASGGQPTFTSLLADAHTALAAVRDVLAAGRYSGPLFVMGRSLGSACAVTLAAYHPDQLRGLIVESGFASVSALLSLFGLRLPFQIAGELPNLDLIRRVTIPTLIIHGEHDSLIPVAAAEELYANSPAADKRLVIIPHADHNDVMVADVSRYFGAIRDFVLP